MLIYPYAHYCHRDSNVNNFLAGSKNIVFCTHCSKINPIIEEHTCTVNDWTNNLRQSELKINLENEQCVSNCLSTNYKFTYQSKYHQFCPEGTYNNYICEDCYPSRSICNTSGTELFHNNNKCKDGYYLEQNKNGSKNRYNIFLIIIIIIKVMINIILMNINMNLIKYVIKNVQNLLRQMNIFVN